MYWPLVGVGIEVYWVPGDSGLKARTIAFWSGEDELSVTVPWMTPPGSSEKLTGVVAFSLTVWPVTRWATRPGDKLTAAVWAFTTKDRVDARYAECAFKRTDTCFRRFWRKIFVAALTIWT